MEDISSKVLKSTVDNIVAKHNQTSQLSHQLNIWLSSLIDGSDDIDSKEDVWDRLEAILNEIEVKNGN